MCVEHNGMERIAFTWQFVEFRSEMLLAASIWSKSANSTFGVNAELSTWGAAVTPGLGPYVGYHTGVGGY